MPKQPFYVIFLVILLFFSCRPLKKVRLFHDSEPLQIELAKVTSEYQISSGDIIHIFIQDLDPENYLFLIPATSQDAKAYSSSYVKGIVIREDGFLNAPFIDSLNILGWTMSQLQDTLEHRYSAFIESPTVHVRLLNYYVNVLGEVKNPGIYTSAQGETFYLHEAIAQAGGLKLAGSRSDVILIRNENGKNVMHEIDLTAEKSIIPNSISLKRGDLIYVQETRRSYAREDLQVVTIALNSITSITALLLIITNLK